MEIKQLVGEILTDIEGLSKDSDEVFFSTTTGKKFKMYHSQVCCESVLIEDVIGDVDDLINSPIVSADEVVNEVEEGPRSSSETWTFYRIMTAKGLVVIRWYGTSNGYYSESVDFREVQ